MYNKYKEVCATSKESTIFEWVTQDSFEPIPVKKAKGIYFWDLNDKKYYDFSSQAVCVNIGHGDKRIIKAANDQFKELTYVWGKNFTTEIRAKLGEALKEVLPNNLSKSFFLSSGAEANEHAIRVAKNYTKKNKIISRYKSYHGSTYGAISISGDNRRLWAEPTMPDVVKVMDPYKYRCRWCSNSTKCNLECLNIIEDTIKFENPNTIAAIFIETITGGSGLLIPDLQYILGIRFLCDKYGILLITDEVMTGFGRTGKWFAAEHYNLKPDILTMAKGLTSAYFPMSAIAISDELAEFYNKVAFPSGSTFNSHPVGCAVALECLKIYKSDRLIENSSNLGYILNDKLKELQKNNKNIIGDVRSIGLFGVIELVKNIETKEPIISLEEMNNPNNIMNQIKSELIRSGLFTIITSNYIFIAPPLCINKRDLLNGVNIINAVLREVKI